MTTVELPSINSLVGLVLEDGETYPSRIEDTEGLVLTVAAPVGAGHTQIGASVLVRWLGERGVYAAPTHLRGTHRSRVALWILEAEGDVEFGTRRGAVRVAIDAPVRIVDPIDDSRWDGRLADISETGVRFRLHGELPRLKLNVRVEFRIEDEELKIPGVVIRTRRGRGDEEGEGVVELRAEERVAQVVRRYVMRRQILARKVREHESH